MSILSEILEELGVVVLGYDSAKTFSLLSHHHGWFLGLLSGIGQDHILGTDDLNNRVISRENLCQALPFVDNFLIDAEATWNILPHASHRSGMWTEVDIQGNEYQLEVRSCWLQGQAILLIENHSPTFSQHQAVYQKARDIALINEKLVSELNQRQRELQNEIEQRILQDTSIRGVAETVKGHTSAVMICQPDGKIEVMNNALIDIYQVTDTAEFQQFSLLDQWVSEAESQYPELKRVLEKGAYWEGEFESKSQDNRNRWIHLTISPIKESSGAVTHYVCVANDISEFREVDASIGGEGGFDITTHLPNRRHFWRHINGFAKQPSSIEKGLGLIYIDLDYFKRVNDDLGHQAGDFLLSAIASRLSRCVKHDNFVAHLGGDEFAVLVNDITDQNQLSQVAERLLASINEPILVDGQSISVSASLGLSLYHQGIFDPTSLVRQADLAMYTAKQLGKGQALLYDPEMERHIPHTLKRERELIDAVENQEFILYLQPQVDAEKGTILRAEALIRWEHPELGLLQPASFISIAEESGIIIPIGTWVLRTACLMGAKLFKEGKSFNIAVNISAKQLRHPDFYKTLVDTLEETGYPAHLLELEITESSFLDDLDAVILLIKKIRKLGVTFSLDDFGTGFSSLNYLRQLPVDYLKIDQSFVQALAYDEQSQAITGFMISLAHELNIKVIAEGVETEEQFNFLLKRKVNFIQGYYFHKPMPFDVLVGKLLI